MIKRAPLPVETGQLFKKLVSPLKGLAKSPFSRLFSLHSRSVLTSGARIALLLVLALALTVPSGIHAQGDSRRLHIVASFSILADVVQNVADDAADVESLIPLGTDPHAFEPSAQDVVTLSEADVVFVAGLFFEAGLLDVLREASPTYYEVWGCLPIRSVTFDFEEHANDDEEITEPPDQTDSLNALCATQQETVKTVFDLEALAPAGAASRLDSGYDDVWKSVDPHVWGDPVNVALWALMIRDMLISTDPANADIYTQNTDAYLSELAALDDEIATLIDTIPSERRVIMTNHASLNYFAARYGLQVVGVVIPGGSTTSEPSVEDVLNLIETVQEYNVPVIFSESTVRKDLAQQIAEETGARTVQLYEGSLSEPDGPAATYIDYMRFTATTMAEALK